MWTGAPVAALRYGESDCRQVLALKRPFETHHFVQNNTEGPGVACVGVSAAARHAARGREGADGVSGREGGGAVRGSGQHFRREVQRRAWVKCHSFTLEERASCTRTAERVRRAVAAALPLGQAEVPELDGEVVA